MYRTTLALAESEGLNSTEINYEKELGVVLMRGLHSKTWVRTVGEHSTYTPPSACASRTREIFAAAWLLKGFSLIGRVTKEGGQGVREREGESFVLFLTIA